MRDLPDLPDLYSAEPIPARAVIMSGAYEHNWARHPILHEACARWQNRLPLYNLRLNTLSAALIRAQLPELPRRVADGRRNHDHVAARLTASGLATVPAPLPPERRAPDSIQFNLEGFSDSQTRAFLDAATTRGLKLQVFGFARDNARAFWNWGFLGALPDLPQTRAMLMRACDLRLPARLSPADCDRIADALVMTLAEARAA